MTLNDFKCVCEDVNLDDYLKLYNYVRDNMEHKEWLGTFTKEEIVEILSRGGKIWIYYDKDKLVCSMFLIPVTDKILNKHNVNTDSKITTSFGPLMVSPKYVGNGFQSAMMKIFNEYAKSIGMKYIFTKAHKDNIYSTRNVLKDGYKIVDEYTNERGNMLAFLKNL